MALPNTAIVAIQDMTSPLEDERVVLQRAMLATEAVQEYTRLVLLGDPGSGKSTFARHLAWALALRGLDQTSLATALFGWNDQRRLLPILLPLRSLAGRLLRDGCHETTVFAALRDELQSYCVQQVDDLIRESLYRGKVLLLFDGLDEVPTQGAPGLAVDRATTLRVVRAFAELYPHVTAIVTCRTRAFDEALRSALGWHVETLAPFTLGQVRHFTPAWYAELVAKGQLEPAQAGRLERELIAAISASPKLTAMAGTPLLLTMMALVLYNKGELPRDRPQLYERILELLLGQWDRVHDGQSLAEAIGQADWDSDRIRPLIDQLSYAAHAGAVSADGRGRMGRAALRDQLWAFFETARLAEPGRAAGRCLDYFEQRSGLLIPDGPDSYVLAHLTLQEHCAGRYIALGSDDPAALVREHRTDDRWREPIMLGMGLVHPAVLNSVLSDLVEREGKAADRWYRDLVLAAEIGQDRDWDYLRTRPMVKVDRLQRALKQGLVALLADKTQPLPVAERVRAGFLLGDLGDPRVPVTLDEWRREIDRAFAGDANGYLCRVEAGAYTIGNADDDPDAGDDEKPQHTVTFDVPFWIGRYPVTNAQWQAWVEQGGGRPSYSADDADLNHANQPVVNITWHMCNDFCAWLGEQIGMTVRLPTEFEWEAAARGGDARHYPWGDEWLTDRAAMEEDQEIRGSRWTVPMGYYAAGAAPCGALDMAGNVWEWTASEWRAYPGAHKPFTEEGRLILRGGSFVDNRTSVRCGARNWGYPDGGNDCYGFRVIVAPRPLPIADGR